MDERTERFIKINNLDGIIPKLERRLKRKKEELQMLQKECQHEILVNYEGTNYCLFCSKKINKKKGLYINVDEQECKKTSLKDIRAIGMGILFTTPQISYAELANEIQEKLKEQK